jgi:hypothetical protein
MSHRLQTGTMTALAATSAKGSLPQKATGFKAARRQVLISIAKPPARAA